MPPNRKGTFDAVDSLATLSVSQFVEVSKFQPLTTTAAPSSSTRSEDEAVVVEPQLQEDPAKQALIERILLEERLREQFSADHILKTEQQRQHEASKTDLHREDTQSDEYWAMTTPKDIESREIHAKRTTDASYWDWPAKTKKQEKDAVIQAILEQERIRQLFSVDHIVLKMQEEAAALQQKQQDKPFLSQNDSYWDWDAQVDLNDQDLQPDKEEIIQHILEAEKLRQEFSAATLEARLLQEAKTCKEDGASRTVAANDDYWGGF